jgi:Flp pilus assembly protein TadG
MTFNLRRWAVDARGASALEFAILLPVFVAMIFGTMQVGLLFLQAGTVQQALEDTARELMVDETLSQAQLQASIDARLEELVSVPVDVTYTVIPIGDVSVMRITAAFSVELIIPFVPTVSVPMDVQTVVPLPD